MQSHIHFCYTVCYSIVVRCISTTVQHYIGAKCRKVHFEFYGNDLKEATLKTIIFATQGKDAKQKPSKLMFRKVQNRHLAVY